MKIQKVIFDGGIFSRGGFALHKITGKFSGHCSAWFSPQGKLEDCEWIRRDGVSRPIREGSPMFLYLESLGTIWK
jgi:hypothetical protein